MVLGSESLKMPCLKTSLESELPIVGRYLHDYLKLADCSING